MKRIQELDSLRDKLQTRKKELHEKQARRAEVSELEQIVQNYIGSWGTEFDKMPVESKRWMLRKIVTAITVDKKEGKAHLTLRLIPTVGEAIGEVYQKMEKTKTAPGIQMPFRRTIVAGTGLEPATFGL